MDVRADDTKGANALNSGQESLRFLLNNRYHEGVFTWGEIHTAKVENYSLAARVKKPIRAGIDHRASNYGIEQLILYHHQCIGCSNVGGNIDIPGESKDFALF